MKRATSLVLAWLMLVSIMASLNPIEMNESEPVEDASGRADYEVWLSGANSPRESTTDISGTVRNAVDVGDEINFDLVIKNIGNNAISDMSVAVTVNNGVTDIIDTSAAPDIAICNEVSICDHQSLAPGDYLANGHYFARDDLGNTLVWTPAVVGTYTVSISIDAGDQDTDLTNNELVFEVVVIDWYDIEVDLVWDSGDEAATGEGPHSFTLTALVNGSSSWDAREVELEVNFDGLFEAYAYDAVAGWAAISQFDSDGDGTMDDCPTADPATTTSCTWSVTLGDSQSVEIYSNLSAQPPTVTNGTRNVAAFQTAYTFAGSIKGDTANANGVGVFTVSASLVNYRIYEEVVTDYGSGPGGNHSADVVNEMMEVNKSLDDRNGNNDDLLTATFASYHDVRVVAVEAGEQHQEGGRLDAGMTRVFARVEHSGSDRTVNYDWAVTFNIKDSNGVDIMGSPVVAVECEDPEGTSTYTHQHLGETVPAQLDGTACVDMMLNPGVFSISATVALLDASLDNTNPGDEADDCGNGTNPACHTDMNGGNNMRTGHFEILNMGPSAYLTMDEVDGPLLDGSRVTFSARAEHLHQPDFNGDGEPDAFSYTWTMIGHSESDPALDLCAGAASCLVDLNVLWLGTPTIKVTVEDHWGATDTAQISFNVWNDYSTSASGDCWAVDYDVLYDGQMAFGVNFTDANDVTGATLEGSSGEWDSICTFDLDSPSPVGQGDVSTETLTVTIDADPSEGHSLWYMGATTWVELTGTTQAQVDADTITLTWDNDGTLPSRPSSTYAVFASATLGQPPQAGITNLAATLGAAAVVELSWEISDSNLVNEDADYGVIYINGDGPALDGDRHTFGLSQTEWTISGEHGVTYEFLVRIENGETDSSGNALFGTPVDSGSATADGQVDPSAGASGLTATKAAGDMIQFAWEAADASDVDHWMVCWSPTEHTSLQVTSLSDAGSCASTTDSSTSYEMARHSGAGNYFYSVAAIDANGNMEAQDSSSALSFTEDYDPGVDNTPIGTPGGEGEIPSGAWIAIIALVILAVVAGAFILTRGGGEGEGDDFDY